MRFVNPAFKGRFDQVDRKIITAIDAQLNPGQKIRLLAAKTELAKTYKSLHEAYFDEVKEWDEIEAIYYGTVKDSDSLYSPIVVGLSRADGWVGWPAKEELHKELINMPGALAAGYGDATNCWWINPSIIVGPVEDVGLVQQKSSGCSCSNCKEFSPYAEPNRPDGSFTCYQCRQDPWRCRS